LRTIADEAGRHEEWCTWHHGERCNCGGRRRATTEAPSCVANVVRLSDVEPEPVRWLWPGRIPLAKLSLVEGHPGIGKSHLTIDFAARVTTGRAFPGDAPSEPANVVILTAEDGLADTVRPRLEAAGGDASRVVVLEDFSMNGEEPRPPIIPDDVPAIRKLVLEEAAALVILDPFSAFLAGAINSWRDHDVRRALAPLARLATETDAAVLVVRHLTKSANGPAITAGGGSIGMIGAARSAMLIAVDPEDESQRVLAVVKSNLAATPPSLTFRLESTPDGRSRIAWGGHSAHTADALIAAGRNAEERGKVDEAKDWLREQLVNGARGKPDIRKAAHANGISEAALDRAKRELKVVHRRDGFGPGACYVWELPPISSARAEHDRPSPPNLIRSNGPACLAPDAKHGDPWDDAIEPDLEQLAIAAYARRNGGAT
jgi:hypothetical protein